MRSSTRLMLCLAAAAGAVCAMPAQAQSDGFAELGALADSSADPASAMALARDQIGDSDLTGALATLERLLVVHPESNDAVLLHAALLCRLDQREDARVELDALAQSGQPSSSPDVAAACGAPGQGRRP